jgi:hypothetical protein
MGGAVRRREGRRRRRGDVEVVEAGALDNSGSGSSHGQLQPSRRTAFPQRPPTPPSPSPFFSASSVRVCGQGNGSPEAARVGRALGFAAAATYSGGQCGGTWTAGMQQRPVGRTATAAMHGAVVLWRQHQQKGEKRRMTMATSS